MNEKDKQKKIILVYNGADHCGGGNCPIVEYNKDADEVLIHDPEKPENGFFRTTREGYNNFLEQEQTRRK